MDSKVKSYVDEDTASQILDEHIKKTIKKEYTVVSKTLALNPYYVYNNRISIKRGFKLKPRIIEHLYWVNTLDGSLIRTKDIPDLDVFENESIQQPKLDKEKCERLSRENAYKHTIRFYKTFWTPNIEAEYKGKIYIPFWNIVVCLTNKNEQHTYAINSFSGEISKQVN
ncbi:MAG: hypothetical protein WCS98_03555 [Bacillota bacterium]|nr:hypothetical protein [Bacillota bacterium]MDD3298187.1 hypothetical protein [Bacillota bacterium]MDD3851514.1 hypothetical protein [Bacillota bacterium]MDD4707047.1 hypothetical protein [Bacillota bacterium]